MIRQQKGTVAKFSHNMRSTGQAQFRADPYQLLVEVVQGLVRVGGLERRVEMGALEGSLVLRIGHAVLPAEAGEFFSTSAANSLNQLRIAVAGEVLKWRRLAVLFSHKQQWDKWGQ